MRWRSITAVAGAVIATLLLLGACGTGTGAGDDPTLQPSVTVLGTSVDTDLPTPTIGSAVSTARD